MKKVFTALCILLLTFPMFSKTMIGTSGNSKQTWSIYWYLCGSDLESSDGAATEDLEEMFRVTLPPNVQVIIESGGTPTWHNDIMNPRKIQRWIYKKNKLNLIEEKPITNMGDSKEFTEFVKFTKKYPADKTMYLFWDHGGGTNGGVACDENYEFDALSLEEIRQSFNAVYGKNNKTPPVELVGFDTCLMATIDVADTFKGYANYLVASEELEPGQGWDYTAWIGALAKNPGINGARLGQYICDSFYASYDHSTQKEVTLSVTDLNKIDPLLKAYEEFGNEALKAAVENPKFLTKFGRKAKKSENYGGNTRSQGYSNMVDLGHLANNCEGLIPDSTINKIRNALDQCILYKINGSYRQNASGLSCYYSYDKEPEDVEMFAKQGISEPFKYFYDYNVYGTVSKEGYNYINKKIYNNSSKTINTVQAVPSLAENADEEYPLDFDKDGYITLKVNQKTLDMLTTVYFNLALIDEEEDLIYFLGTDNDIDADWNRGIFKDNFRNVWGSIDGHLVYMEMVYEDEEYTEFTVPVLLNGEEYNLKVIFDYNDEQFHIMGARQEISEQGMGDKNLRKLKPGDKITTIHYIASLSGDDDEEEVEMDTFRVKKNTKFEEAYLSDIVGDATYLMYFTMEDASNNIVDSQVVQIDMYGDEMELTILE